MKCYKNELEIETEWTTLYTFSYIMLMVSFGGLKSHPTSYSASSSQCNPNIAPESSPK